MLKALSAARVMPELLIGTSVGAINAAFTAAGAGPRDAAELERIWLDVRRGDVFPVKPLRGLSALLTRQDALFSPDSLRQLVVSHLRYERLEDAPIPVAVVAADVVSGREVVLRSGDAVDAVLASAAIPGVFPAVTTGDLELVDGGFVNHTPISTAVELGATTIYVLPTGFPCTLPTRPRGALAVALQAVTNLLSQRLADDIALPGRRGSSRGAATVPAAGVSRGLRSHRVVDRSRPRQHRRMACGKHAGRWQAPGAPPPRRGARRTAHGFRHGDVVRDRTGYRRTTCPKRVRGPPTATACRAMLCWRREEAVR